MKHISLVAAAATLCLAGPTSANTLIFGGPLDERPYGGFGEAVNPNIPVEFDFVGGLSDDGVNDLPDGNVDLTISDTSLTINSTFVLEGFDIPAAQFGGFAYSVGTDDPFRFNPGDEIGLSRDEYQFRTGPLVVGDHLNFGENGIFGFIISLARLVAPVDADLSGFIDDEGFADEDAYCREVGLACDNQEFERYFGWVQVTQGSVIPGYIGFGFSQSAGAIIPGDLPAAPSPSAAPVSPVPLPAAGWMLIAGLGGLIAVGRRKTA